MAFRGFIHNPTDELISASEHIQHAEALKNVRSIVDTSRPSKYSPKATNKSGKTLFYLKNRRREIEGQNKHLLDRLFDIMTIPRTTKARRSSTSNAPRSLNIERRRERIKRINVENRAFLKKLSSVRPCLSREAWRQFEEESQRRRSNILEWRNGIRNLMTKVSTPKPRSVALRTPSPNEPTKRPRTTMFKGRRRQLKKLDNRNDANG
jgi:hypothetical protein